MDRPNWQITLEEHRTIFRLLNSKLPAAEIANRLGL